MPRVQHYEETDEPLADLEGSRSGSDPGPQPKGRMVPMLKLRRGSQRRQVRLRLIRKGGLMLVLERGQPGLGPMESLLAIGCYCFGGCKYEVCR